MKTNKELPHITYLAEIDEEATIAKGKNVCRQYAPLIQRRRKELMKTPMRTGSLIQVSNDIRSGNAYEMELLKRCGWEADDISKFCEYIMELETQEQCKIAGQYLKWKYIYEKTDTEILDIIPTSKGTLIKNKKFAYYLVAGWANGVCYINWKEEKTFEFEDEELYDDMY